MAVNVADFWNRGIGNRASFSIEVRDARKRLIAGCEFEVEDDAFKPLENLI